MPLSHQRDTSTRGFTRGFSFSRSFAQKSLLWDSIFVFFFVWMELWENLQLCFHCEISTHQGMFGTLRWYTKQTQRTNGWNKFRWKKMITERSYRLLERDHWYWCWSCKVSLTCRASHPYENHVPCPERWYSLRQPFWMELSWKWRVTCSQKTYWLWKTRKIAPVLRICVLFRWSCSGLQVVLFSKGLTCCNTTRSLCPDETETVNLRVSNGPCSAPKEKTSQQQVAAMKLLLKVGHEKERVISWEKRKLPWVDPAFGEGQSNSSYLRSWRFHITKKEI